MQLKKSAHHGWQHFRIAIATSFIALTSLASGQETATDPAAQVAAAQPVSAGTLDRVRASGKLVLGYRTDAPPLSYVDGSGQAAGYSVLLCRKIATDIKSSLGLSALAVEWVALAAESGIDAVQQGKVDLLCGADAATLAARAAVSFSLPIFPGGIAALLSSDGTKNLQQVLEQRPPAYQPNWRGSNAQSLKSLETKTYSVVAGSAAAQWLVSRISALGFNAKVAPTDSYDAGVAKIVEGDADVLFGDRASLLDAAKRSPDGNDLKVLNRHFTFESQALVLQRNDDAFRLLVDQSLSGFYATPEFGDIYTAAFGPADVDTIAFFRMTHQ